jgi:hypothetical protein
VFGDEMNSMSNVVKKPPDILGIVALHDGDEEQVGTIAEALDSENQLVEFE